MSRSRIVSAAGVLLMAVSGTAQTITTIAGGGPPNGSSALRAGIGGFQAGNSISTDAAGNLYIADFNANRVYRVAPDGTLTTIAGDGTFAAPIKDNVPAAGNKFPNPVAVVPDAAGNLYLASLGAGRVHEIFGGTLITIGGSGYPGYGGD